MLYYKHKFIKLSSVLIKSLTKVRKCGRILFVKCPRCKGLLRVEKDKYGWYLECIFCGYHKNIEVKKWKE